MTASLRLSTPQIYRWFAVAVLVALTIPRMTQRGIFGDGLIYASVSRNMSAGVGSFWAPSYTLTQSPEFNESPPVGLGLEAMLFRIFGDHFFVERLYSLALFAITALLITRLWRRVQPAAYDWLPLVLWILPAIVTWGAVNNMLENTQTAFTTAAVLLALVAYHAPRMSATAAWSTAAAMCAVAAILTKGPVGFFLLAVPPLLWLLPLGRDGEAVPARSIAKPLVMAAVILGVFTVCGVALVAYEPSHHWATEYVRFQLVPSLQGKREVSGDPLAAVRHLFLGVVARMLIMAALIWIFGRRTTATSSLRPAWWFLALGLAASVPIAISPKLVGHYFLPSVPLFAIGIASLMIRPASLLIGDEPGWHRRVPAGLASALVVATVLVPILHGPIEPRGRATLRDLDAIASAMPPRGTIIGACRTLPTDLALHGYVNRLFQVSLQAADAPVNGWLLQPDKTCEPPPACREAAHGERLVLFECPK